MAVTDDEQPEAATQSEQNEAVFVLGVVGIVDQLCALVNKHGFGLFEANAMLYDVG